MNYYKILSIYCLSFFAIHAQENMRAVTQFPLNASYVIENSWPTGYQVLVTVRNNTANPTSSWMSSFALGQGQSVSDLWNGVLKTNSQTVTVTNPTWYSGGIISANGSTTFGFIVSNPQSTTPALSNLQAVANGSTSTLPIPSAPTLNPITVNATTPNTYTVSWNNVTNATSYTLQRAITSSFTNPVVVAQGSMTSQIFNNQPNGTYFYRVSASNATGTSPFSATKSVVINTSIQLKAPVLQAISNASGSNQYQIVWNAVANATGYVLQQSSSNTFSNPQTVFTGAATSAMISVQALGTYYYRVQALSGSITSPSSNIVNTTVTQLPAPSGSLIESYWESWNSADPISAIVNMHVDIINISFANFASTGTHTYAIAGVESTPAVIAQLVTLAHNAGKKVKIAVGGATYPLAPQLKTTQDAIGMAQAIATYVQQNNLDGIDFDIEDYPAPALQIALIQNTRQLLGSSKLVSYTPKAPASTTFPYYTVIQGAHQYLDAILIMAYNYYPGYSAQEDAEALIAMGVPASKISIGLMPGYDDIGVMTSLADITEAAQYIEQNGLQGIMFWDLNRDLSNATGLGASAATNTAWNVFNS